MEPAKGALDRRLADGLRNHQAARTRPARGPLVLASISNSTCEPLVRDSKAPPSTLERWKKYSTPSSAARNPNPRSLIDLIVPIGICNLPCRSAALLASLIDRPAREVSGGERSITNAKDSSRVPQAARSGGTAARSKPAAGRDGHESRQPGRAELPRELLLGWLEARVACQQPLRRS